VFKSWLAGTSVFDGEYTRLMDAPPGTRYLYSLYWAIAIVETIGYGDIKPAQPLTVVMLLIVMLTGVFIFSYLPPPLTTKPNFCMKHDVAGTSWETWPPSCICSTVSKRRPASFERMYVVPTLELHRLFETRLKPVSVCVDVLKISFMNITCRFNASTSTRRSLITLPSGSMLGLCSSAHGCSYSQYRPS
jgi:hypothetical protein